VNATANPKEELLYAVQVDYNKAYLLPLDEACQLFSLLSKAALVQVDYKGNVQNYVPHDLDIGIKPIPTSNINKYFVENAIGVGVTRND